MRKIVITLVALSLVAASTAFADVLMSEPFSYADGGICTVSGGLWVTHSGTTTDVQILNGEALVIGANANDVNRSFTEQSATAKTYASFSVMVAGTAATGTGYFAHFKNTGNYYAGHTYVVGTGTTTYTLGISSTSTISATWPTALNCDTYYNVVTAYDASTGISTLWVNPANEASTSISSVAGYTGTLVSAYALRQASPTANTIHVDDLGVATTFAEAYASGPTPASSGTWGKLKSLYR